MMNLKGKVIGLFIFGFALMAFFALTLFHNTLRNGFLEIEHKQAIEQMQQLSHNLNGELDKLSQVTSDWGNWDDAYSYMQHPSNSFTDHNATAVSLKEIEIKYLAMLDNQGQTIFSEAVNLMTGEKENPTGFNSVLVNIKKRIAHPTPGTEKACGLDLSSTGPLLICWQPIRKSDLTGNPVGTVIVARLLNSKLINKLQLQSNIKFDLEPLTIKDAEPTAQVKENVEPEKVEFSKNEPRVLNAFLVNIVGQEILKVRLVFSNEVSSRGAEMTWEEIRNLLLVTLIVGAIIFAGIYYLIFRHMQKMAFDLKSIWRNGRWAERLDIAKEPNELSDITHSINRMLGLIRKQSLILESIAHTDTLTQIANRRSFEQRILIEMSLHKRNQTPLSLLFLEIDYFNQYNDLYGHPAGDELLIQIGKLLTQVACRPSDLPARIAEQEFAVILPTTDLEGAKHVAEILRSRLAEQKIPNANSPISEFITVSIGLTSAGEEDLSSLIQRAEKASDNAKQSGRNQIYTLPPN
jgi:diguanylate cyclase (GGDEF)-like protein